jgi:pyridoxal phosphate enzyme (YggS family)
MDNEKNRITTRINAIYKRTRNACTASNRDPATVRLLLATKTVPAGKIRIAIQAGATLAGENKVQELREKAPALTDLNYEQHFIGHLQTNKVKEVLRYVSCIQSVDRITLVQELDKYLLAAGRSMDILVQVNTSYEQSKFGLVPEAVPDFIRQVARYDTLNIKGLMTIGLFDTDAEKVRPSFHLLKKLQDEVTDLDINRVSMQELSMGMSDDLETAIEEGATMVRVGTAIFGQRIYTDQYYWNENTNSES